MSLRINTADSEKEIHLIFRLRILGDHRQIQPLRHTHAHDRFENITALLRRKKPMSMSIISTVDIDIFKHVKRRIAMP